MYWREKEAQKQTQKNSNSYCLGKERWSYKEVEELVY